MPLKYAPVIRVCFALGTLMWCGAQAAEQKPSLIGATRTEVLARFGEPKSQIVVGNRQVLFFAQERVVLRDDRVIEAEELAVDAVSPAEKSAVPAASTEGSATAAVTPKAGGAITPPGQGEVASDVADPAVKPARVVPEVTIKSVRPPSRTAANPATQRQPSPTTAPIPSQPASATPAKPAALPAPAIPASAAPAAPVQETKVVAAETPVDAVAPAPAPAGEAPANATAVAEAPVSPGVASAPVAPVARPKRQRPTAEAESDTADVVTSAFTGQTYLIALGLIGGGIGYLGWRARQRRLALDATVVSGSPFEAPESSANGDAKFTLELLNQLEWKRFEELVAAYYNKTGVVAARTKTGPSTPVQIRISWKGEQKPFACVKCITHTQGLIEAKPVQDLCDTLAAEDIRRGYVVTTGKFGVPARDLAEEKHVTLLPGDLLLEKLNALPESARAELLKLATAGDYSTPSCPRCDIAMVRSSEDRTAWSCVQCGDVVRQP